MTKQGILLIVRVRAWKKEHILPQRLDFILPHLCSVLSCRILDIQPIRRLGYYTGYLFSFLMAFPSVLFLKYDFIILENPYLVILSPLAKIRRKKIITEYVDYYPSNLVRLKNEKFFRYQIAKVICRIFSKFVDKITTESSTGQNILVQWGVPISKIHIIAVAIDTNKMKFDPKKRNILRSEYGFTNKQLVIGYLGKMANYYNLDNILNAIVMIKNHKTKISTIFVGDGPERNRLENLAKKLDLSIIFTGAIPHDDVSSYYSLMDLFVFPLDALAIKIGEILSIGLPLIAPRGMAEDWIQNMETGIIAKDTTMGSLQNAIEIFLKLPSETIKRMNANQQKFAKTHLDIKIIVKKYLNLLV